MMKTSITKTLASIFKEHGQVAKRTFTQNECRNLEKITREIVRAFQKNKKVLLCGNGGSAADAQHIAAEFIVRFKRERRSLAAIALTTDTSILTAIANDYDYESVFRRQVEGLGSRDDILIAISTSGNSPNVIAAVLAAKKIGMTTIAFTGETGGKLTAHTDFSFCAKSRKTPHVQEMHITALHAISEAVEDKLFD